MAERTAYRAVLSDLRGAPGQTPAFVLIHLGCLLVFVTGAPWDAMAIGAASYVLRGLGISAGYHRYFAHHSFKTSRAFQLVLALLGTLTMQKGVLWWVAHHRHHHQVADRAADVHSPRQHGFWWAHIGWFLASAHEATEWSRVRDLARYPELVWLNRHFAVPTLFFAVALALAGGLPWLVWGFFLSTTAMLHLTCAVNSVAHRRGSRSFPTADDSRNNAWLAVLTLGEGWHNNHHHAMRAARIGVRWWQVDPTYYALVALAGIGIIWDLVPPPRARSTTHAARANAASSTAVSPAQIAVGRRKSSPTSA